MTMAANYQCGFCEFKCDKNEDMTKHISSSQLEEIKKVNIARLIQAAQHIEAAMTMAAMAELAVMPAMPVVAAGPARPVVAVVAAGPAMPVVPVVAAGPAMPVVPVVAAGPVVAIQSASRPCELCGFIPGTKDSNKQRDRKSHLFGHYKERIEASLEGLNDCPYPRCTLYKPKKHSKFELRRHYNDNHKICEEYLLEEIKNIVAQTVDMHENCPL